MLDGINLMQGHTPSTSSRHMMHCGGERPDFWQSGKSFCAVAGSCQESGCQAELDAEGSRPKRGTVPLGTANKTAAAGWSDEDDEPEIIEAADGGDADQVQD